MQDLVYSLVASPNFAQDGICFAARPSGLYRSGDGGHSWQDAYHSLNLEAPLSTLAVVVSPDFESDQSVFAGVSGGILRSDDSGSSWQPAIFPEPPPLISALAVSPNFSRDGILLAGTVEDGVFRSADRGHTWPSWNFGLLDLNVFALAISPDFANDEMLFAGTESGIFRSTNGGRAWREVDLPIGFEPVLSLAFSPDFAHDETLFAGTESRGLFCSNDRGRTWMQRGHQIMENAINAIVLSPAFPAKPGVLVLQGDTLLVSRDGGQSWSDSITASRLEQGVASVAAPQGLDPEALLLVGLLDGSVKKIQI